MPSLRDIEKTVSTLWMNRQARNWLLSGGKGQRPPNLQDAPLELLSAVDKDGVRLYGNLMNYGHHDVMESIYPFCSKILGRAWSNTVDDYLEKLPPDHYNFNRLCYRLSEYFTEYGDKLMEKHPYLAELADYEWIELEKIEQDVDIKVYPAPPLTTPEQIAALAPVVNPTVTVRKYEYNIPEIAEKVESGAKLPTKIKKETTYVAILRHGETHRCRFVEIGPAAAHIIELAASQTLSYQSLIPVVVSMTPNVDPQKSVSDFLQLIEDFQEMHVFVGSIQAG